MYLREYIKTVEKKCTYVSILKLWKKMYLREYIKTVEKNVLT